jgi:hypothetical protein
MKRRPSEREEKGRFPGSSVVDELYGLEPVFEPGRSVDDRPDDRSVCGVVEVQCPYCGEPFTTALDLSAGSASYIEDCQVCCQPIEFAIVIGTGGELDALELRRSD